MDQDQIAKQIYEGIINVQRRMEEKLGGADEIFRKRNWEFKEQKILN